MNNIKKARINAGYAQKRVAIELHVSTPTVSEWESGKKTPSTANIRNLCELFKVPADYLLGITDDPTMYNPKNKSFICPHPISILAVQYNIDSTLLAKITGVNADIAMSWTPKSDSLNSNALEAISSFFEISRKNLESGVIPICTKLSVQNKVKNFLNIPSAAFEKEGEYTLDDFNDSPIKRENAPSFSNEALEIAKKYDTLDGHGKELISVVLEKETERSSQPQKQYIKLAARGKDSGKIHLIEDIPTDVPFPEPDNDPDL